MKWMGVWCEQEGAEHAALGNSDSQHWIGGAVTSSAIKWMMWNLTYNYGVLYCSIMSLMAQHKLIFFVKGGWGWGGADLGHCSEVPYEAKVLKDQAGFFVVLSQISGKYSCYSMPWHFGPFGGDNLQDRKILLIRKHVFDHMPEPLLSWWEQPR